MYSGVYWVSAGFFKVFYQSMALVSGVFSFTRRIPLSFYHPFFLRLTVVMSGAPP
jgi:hypothetical protein